MSLQGCAVLFDLDGTLVDTAPDLIAALNHVLLSVGLPACPDNLARPQVAYGAAALLRVGYAAAGTAIEERDLPERVEEFLAHYRVHIADNSRPFRGAIDTLHALKASGARLAIATNKRQDLTIALLERLSLMEIFTTVAGADTVTARKPDARHLLETAYRTAVMPSRCVYVGDTSVDERAARAAGLPFVFCSFGYTDQSQSLFRPDAILHDFAELPAILQMLLARSGPGSESGYRAECPQ